MKRALTRFAAGVVLAVLLLLPEAGRAVCNVAATGVAFPPYDAFSPSAATGVGTVSVTCDEVAPPNVALSLSAGSSGSFSPRRMTRAGGGGTLSYNVFTTTGGTAVWGDGGAGTSTVFLHRVRKNEVARVTNIYATIPAGQRCWGIAITPEILMIADTCPLILPIHRDPDALRKRHLLVIFIVEASVFQARSDNAAIAG